MSNLFSRLVPTSDEHPFGRLRDDDDADVEAALNQAIDDENLAHRFNDDDLDNANGLEDSRISTMSPESHTRPRYRQPPGATEQASASRWLSQDDDVDNDVPASLLVEATGGGSVPGSSTANPNPRRSGPQPSRTPPALGLSNKRTQSQWEAAQAHQRLHDDDQGHILPSHHLLRAVGPRPTVNNHPRDKAMYRWASVSNLDIFMKDVYDYYLGAGFWCIMLDQLLHLVKILFMAILLTLLTQCVNYSLIRDSKTFSQVLVPQCTKNMWWSWNMGLWMCSFYLVWKLIQWTVDIPRLMHMRDFYIYLLEIPEEDMQTISWQDVVSKITGLRDQNFKTATTMTQSHRKFITRYLGKDVASQSKERLDAHDIANRLMRRENYMIALFNKDILNLSAPVPFLRNRQLFSRSLEFSIQFAIFDLIFTENGLVRPRVLKSVERGDLIKHMTMRFFFAGTMNLVLAPLLAWYLVIDFIFTYYNEFKTNTSSIGSRQYTPLARWKFREFNELPHLFAERLNMSHPFAKHYFDQFPKKKTESLARAVQFVAGAVIAVLAIVGFSDPEMFVDFEIFPGLNAFAFFAIMGTVWAIARGQISEENDVFDPEFAMRNVIEYTHYEPDQWKDRLHSHDVKVEFGDLYKPSVVIFLEEIVAILVTPLVLFFSLPKCAAQITDFFREFTIHVDGLGYVCSFAVFDFQKDPRNTRQQQQQVAAADAREDYYTTKHNKMQASIHGFLDNYVYNPRSGLPGSHPLGGPASRHQFHPPPHFPGLMSPTLAADMRMSRVGRPTSRAPPGPQNNRAARPPVAPSPMASMLLDPHHHPSSSTVATRGPRGRQPPGFRDEHLIEESMEDSRRNTLKRHGTSFMEDGGGVEESVARLGESTWEGSPQQPLTRESSALADKSEDQAGVVTLLKQFQQAHMNQRGTM